MIRQRMGQHTATPTVAATTTTATMRSPGRAYLITGLCLLLSLASVLFAHPFHITTSEAQVNAKERTLEVALELNPAELEQAMELRWNRNVDLDAADAEALVARYTEEVFKVFRRGKPALFKWVGQELGITSGWLYFQFEEIDGLSSLMVENRFLVEVAQNNDGEQLNTIRFKDPTAKGGAPRKLSLTFVPPTYRLTIGTTSKGP